MAVMDDVVTWLLEGDSAVRHQVWRDLLGEDRADLASAVGTDGDAAALLAARNADGHWGRGFYQPKWTSSHYTLLELRGLELPRTDPAARETVGLILREVGPDGGVNPSGTIRHSDACINGMFCDYASWFGASDAELAGVVDFLLGQTMPDGGYNCRRNRSGARVASVHTTVAVLEGFTSYLAAGATRRTGEVRAARDAAVECLLARELFRRRGTEEPIEMEFTRLHHPARWHFDVLRALDTLRAAGVAHDPRMNAALDAVRQRRRPDGRWAANSGYAGETHFRYPSAGQPNRWVTLRALRVLQAYQ
jgi:hypothetical protein